MNRPPSAMRAAHSIFVTLLLTLLALAPAGTARASDVVVWPPGSAQFGRTYEELSSQWWAWMLEQPASINPALDLTGANCQQGQTSRIWFLAGMFFGGTATRTCTIPANRALFIPALNSFIDNNGVPGSQNCPPGHFTETELRQQITAFLDTKTTADIQVDGNSVPVYRIDQGALFSYHVPSDFVFNSICDTPIPPGLVKGAVSGGYYTFLAPLPPGRHTIQILGDAGDTHINVTYQLTVGSDTSASARTPHASGAGTSHHRHRRR